MFEFLIEKIARMLDEAGVRYMIIGGQAVLFYFSFDNIPAHLNRGLFADLEDPARLRDLAEWKEADGAEEVFQGITLLYQQHAVRFKKQTNEAQTEHDFIQPLLHLIWGGSCYQVQVTIPNVDGRRQPDYAFFRTAEERQAADQRKAVLQLGTGVPRR